MEPGEGGSERRQGTEPICTRCNADVLIIHPPDVSVFSQEGHHPVIVRKEKNVGKFSRAVEFIDRQSDSLRESIVARYCERFQ